MLSLVLEIWPTIFKEMNTLVTLIKRVFCQSPLHCRPFRDFMENKLNYLLTRWGTWVNAVAYLAEYLDVLGEFISSGEVTSRSACFGELKALLSTNVCRLKTEALFIKKHGGMIVSTLDQNRFPLLTVLMVSCTIFLTIWNMGA